MVDLAKHYLPDLTRESIQASWIEVRDGLTQVLMRKEDQRRRVSAALSESTTGVILQEDRLLEISASLDEAKTEQDQISAKGRGRTGRRTRTFNSLSGRAAVAEAALERAEANLSEIEQEATQKLPAYEESSLFKYLKERKFGTEEYAKRGFTRRMDRWVAKYIDYNKAKQGYEFLVETPEQMRKIIADDREA